MTRAIAFAAFLLALSPGVADAQMPGHSFGLGLHFGDPSFAFSGKYWLDSQEAVQATLGWRYYGSSAPVITVDWQRRVGRIVPRTPVVRFGFDLGVGGGLGYLATECYRDVWGRETCYNEDAALFLRVPLAFTAYFTRANVEAYAELTPTISLVPDFEPVVMGGFGGRFYF